MRFNSRIHTLPLHFISRIHFNTCQVHSTSQVKCNSTQFMSQLGYTPIQNTAFLEYYPQQHSNTSHFIPFHLSKQLDTPRPIPRIHYMPSHFSNTYHLKPFHITTRIHTRTTHFTTRIHCITVHTTNTTTGYPHPIFLYQQSYQSFPSAAPSCTGTSPPFSFQLK